MNKIKNNKKCKCLMPILVQNGAQPGYEKIWCRKCGKERRCD